MHGRGALHDSANAGKVTTARGVSLDWGNSRGTIVTGIEKGFQPTSIRVKKASISGGAQPASEKKFMMWRNACARGLHVIWVGAR